jgi:hypothetical protein
MMQVTHPLRLTRHPVLAALYGARMHEGGAAGHFVIRHPPGVHASASRSVKVPASRVSIAATAPAVSPCIHTPATSTLLTAPAIRLRVSLRS